MISKMSIDKIVVNERFRQDLGDQDGSLDALVDSIKERGLLQPLAVTPDAKLIAGRRRLEAVRKLGWSEIPVHIVSGLDDAVQSLKAERDENVCRKDFTLSEKAALG